MRKRTTYTKRTCLFEFLKRIIHENAGVGLDVENLNVGVGVNRTHDAPLVAGFEVAWHLNGGVGVSMQIARALDAGD